MFTSVNSFKAQIKNIAKEKGIAAQQVQQHYLIEQVLKLIAKSRYKNTFIVKGGYLIGQLIGLERRTTMDLDVTLKGQTLTPERITAIFSEILTSSSDEFSFEIDRVDPIRQDDEYGGFSLKLIASFGTLKEVVFIDITTGDAITPKEISYTLASLFNHEPIEIWTYNLETILSEKLETIISRGLASTRPRDRYDLFTLYHLRKNEIDFDVLQQALHNTAQKRGTLSQIASWIDQINGIETSDYQHQLWSRYQKQFPYAKTISFEESVMVIQQIMQHII